MTGAFCPFCHSCSFKPFFIEVALQAKMVADPDPNTILDVEVLGGEVPTVDAPHLSSLLSKSRVEVGGHTTC